MDNGHVRQFGDYKASTTAALGKTVGNAALLDGFAGHQGHAPDERAGAVPLLLFRAVSRSGKVKGHVEFCGLGIIERAERLVICVAQVCRANSPRPEGRRGTFEYARWPRWRREPTACCPRPGGSGAIGGVQAPAWNVPTGRPRCAPG
ncbi:MULTISPECIES: hypothetical protein [unclassified Streptomyces]|uniref:hypothetical protein n=1 Tax=Streptomyces sp. NPDC127129 TaxID=3345373 RepID=UPI00363B65C7